MTPGEAIRKRRKKLGLTVVKAAKITGLSVSHISLLERGKRRMNKRVLGRLYRILMLKKCPSCHGEGRPPLCHHHRKRT